MRFLLPLIRPCGALLVIAFLSACSMQPGVGPGPVAPGRAASDSLRLAQATAESGDHQTAAKLFEKVVAAEPDSVPALLGLGDSYSRIGQKGRAESVLTRAHELDKQNADVLAVLGRVKLSQDQPEAAVAFYDKALRLNRGHISALTGKGVALDTLSRHAEAQRVYQAGLTRYPSNFVLRNNYALSLSLSGEGDRSVAMLQELVRDPQVAPHVRDNLALAYGLNGREDEARATLALDLSSAEIEQNIATYRSLRRMMVQGRPIGALVFA